MLCKVTLGGEDRKLATLIEFIDARILEGTTLLHRYASVGTRQGSNVPVDETEGTETADTIDEMETALTVI